MSEQFQPMKIFEALNGIMKAMKPVEKTGENTSAKGEYQMINFKFQKIDHIINQLHSLLAEYGVIIIPTVLSENLIPLEQQIYKNHKGTQFFRFLVKMQYDFVALDGSKISVTMTGENNDSGSYANSKAITFAYKKTLLQVFCITTEEEVAKDAEGEDQTFQQPNSERFYEAKAQTKTYQNNKYTTNNNGQKAANTQQKTGQAPSDKAPSPKRILFNTMKELGIPEQLGGFIYDELIKKNVSFVVNKNFANTVKTIAESTTRRG